LRRLEAQTSEYLSFFDDVIVVLASRHLKSIDWKFLLDAEVWEVCPDGTLNVLFVPLGRDRFKRSFVELLTQQERRKLYPKREEGVAFFSETEADRKKFAIAFRGRFGATSDIFWKTVGRRSINSDDLKLLSRFRAAREEKRKWSEQQDSIWEDWQNRLAEIFPTSNLATLRQYRIDPPDLSRTTGDANECLCEQLLPALGT
jgi:hypothetical protein